MNIFTKQNVYRRRVFPCQPSWFIRSVLPGVQYTCILWRHLITGFHEESCTGGLMLTNGTLLEPINLVWITIPYMKHFIYRIYLFTNCPKYDSTIHYSLYNTVKCLRPLININHNSSKHIVSSHLKTTTFKRFLIHLNQFQIAQENFWIIQPMLSIFLQK